MAQDKSKSGATRKSREATASANPGEEHDKDTPTAQPKPDESSATSSQDATDTPSGEQHADALNQQPEGEPDKTGEQQGGGQEQPRAATGRQGDSGPGTGVDAPEDRNAARYPASTLDPNPESAPLDPPRDQQTQTKPETGYAESTTDQTYAETGGRTIAGENHVRLVDAEGNGLSADGLFDESDTTKTYVTTKTRIFEVFTYPNTTREATRLLYAEGRRVPRFQAERIKRAVDAGV